MGNGVVRVFKFEHGATCKGPIEFHFHHQRSELFRFDYFDHEKK